jgi:hypothetical protein
MSVSAMNRVGLVTESPRSSPDRHLLDQTVEARKGFRTNPGNVELSRPCWRASCCAADEDGTAGAILRGSHPSFRPRRTWHGDLPMADRAGEDDRQPHGCPFLTWGLSALAEPGPGLVPGGSSGRRSAGQPASRTR